jgi:hypothetical protein
MSATIQAASIDLSSTWGKHLLAAICEKCGWRYLLPAAFLSPQGQLPLCPHCFQSTLVAAGENLAQMPYYFPAEMVAPYTVRPEELAVTVRQFARSIPYPPVDLTLANLQTRLAPVYLPVWLVDAAVSSYWQADAGFNYQIASHEEYYNDNSRSWQTKEVREDRIRWEARVGRLNRDYQNVNAPALEETTRIKKLLGDFNSTKPEPYHPEHTARAFVCLPERPPKDAWTEAVAGFQQWATTECQEACAADHLRHFRWKAQFNHLHWTLLLQPVFSTYYLDDEGQPQTVLIHGQNGQIAGRRRASMRRAQKSGLLFFAFGLILAILGLGLGVVSTSLRAALPLGIIALVVGIPSMLSALIPIFIAWDYNRKTD